MNRLDSKCYNRKTLEALIKGGAFDSTGYTRKQLMYFVDETPLLESAAKRQKDKDLGQTSMFDLFDDFEEEFGEEIPAPDGIEWDKRQKLAYEKEIMKIYVSEHPLAPYESAIAKITKTTLGSLAERNEDVKSVTVVGLISSLQTKLMKNGKKMASFTLEDTTGYAECVCFKYEDYADCMYEDAIVKVKGKFEHSERGNQLIAYEIELLEFANQQTRIPTLNISLYSSEYTQESSLKLSRILKSYPGASPVNLIYTQKDGKRFKAPLPVQVDAESPVLKIEIERLFGRSVMDLG